MLTEYKNEVERLQKENNFLKEAISATRRREKRRVSDLRSIIDSFSEHCPAYSSKSSLGDGLHSFTSVVAESRCEAINTVATTGKIQRDE